MGYRGNLKVMESLNLIPTCTFARNKPRYTMTQIDISSYREILENRVSASGEVDYPSIIPNKYSEIKPNPKKTIRYNIHNWAIND